MVDAIALRKNTKLPASVCNLPHLTDFTSLRFFACTFPRVLYARIYVVSTSNRARCNINRFHESIGSLGSLCRSLYRRTHVALRCTTRSTDPLVRLWPRKENYVHTYLPRAAETQISFYLLPFLFLSFSLFSFFLWGGGRVDGIISGLWISRNNSRTVRADYVQQMVTFLEIMLVYVRIRKRKFSFGFIEYIGNQHLFQLL